MGDFTLDEIGPELDRTQQRITKAAVKGLRMAAHDARKEVLRQIQVTTPFAPIDTGEGSRSSSWPITALPNNEGWQLTTTADHMAIMELGTRPFWAPIAPLLAWARRKLRRKPRRKKKQRASQRKRSSSVSTPDDAATARALGRQADAAEALENKAQNMAWGTRHNISKHGISGRLYYARATAHFGVITERRLRQALAKVRR